MAPTETTQPPIVVVDSNAVAHGAWRLDSAAWKVVLHQARAEHIRLVVPELVLREVVGRFGSELVTRLSQAARTVRKLNELSHAAAAAAPMIDEREEVATYERAIRSTLAESKAETPGLPEVNIDELVDRAISQRRPFDESGSGFRDALLWQTVIDRMSSSPDNPLYLISNDSRAFWDAGALHPQLQKDLDNRHLTQPFSLFDSLASYLDAAGITDPRLIAQILEALQYQQGDLVEVAKTALRGEQLHSPWALVGIWISELESLTVSLDRSSGAADDGDLYLVHLVIEGHARLELRVGDNATPIITTVTAPLRVAGLPPTTRLSGAWAI